MSAFQDIVNRFEDIGGEFCTSPEQIADRLKSVRVFLFDWDGVFNDGMKFGDLGSPFGEDDSMGVNLLRLSYWLNHGKLPITGILTGATNEAAEYFAKREGLQVCIRGFTDKGEAFRKFCEQFEVDPSEVAFVFDDVLDLPVAKTAGVRMCVVRRTSPLFADYVEENNLCDYLTASKGGQGAVRECAELIIGMTSAFNDVVDVRTDYGEQYSEYLALRKAVKTIVIAP